MIPLAGEHRAGLGHRLLEELPGQPAEHEGAVEVERRVEPLAGGEGLLLGRGYELAAG